MTSTPGGSPDPTLRRGRDRADLPHHAELVKGDAALADAPLQRQPEDRDPVHRDRLARGRNAHERTLVCAVRDASRSDAVAVRKQIQYLIAQVREGAAERP